MIKYKYSRAWLSNHQTYYKVSSHQNSYKIHEKLWILVFKNLFSWPLFPITDLCYLRIMCRSKQNYTRSVKPVLTLKSSLTITSLPAPPTSPLLLSQLQPSTNQALLTFIDMTQKSVENYELKSRKTLYIDDKN